MKRYFAFAVLLLVAGVAQAGVYKCKSSSGMVYSEVPCPDGSTEGAYRPAPAVSQQSDESDEGQQMSHGGDGIENIDAVPLPNPATQRVAYKQFLASPSPRAFVICSDGRVMSFGGKQNFVDQRLASLPAGCKPYAIDDHLAQ